MAKTDFNDKLLNKRQLFWCFMYTGGKKSMWIYIRHKQTECDTEAWFS